MEKLIIEATLNSPRVELDPADNRFEFSGESRPENVRSFYLPILDWLEEYAADLSKNGKKNPLTLNFNLEYFNSTSAKYILDIFKSLYSIHEGGNEVLIRWHYEEDDEDMYEVGMEMSRMSRLPFEYVKTEV
jgi:hypothetical protein